MAWLAFKGNRRLGLIALVMALGVSTASMARAADVVLRVDGLACPFCAFGIEKKLMDVPAVAGMDILLNDGKVIVELREGERLDAVALNRAVEDAGFTLHKILVENAVGILSQTDEGEFLLESSDPLFAFRLRFDARDAAAGATATRGPTRVEVTGELTEFVVEPAPLVVTTIQRLDAVAGGPR